MGFKCGIVGLPNVGKSTLFNALTRSSAAEVANYPFSTIEPKAAEILVPDHRLEQVATVAGMQLQVPARLEFVDIAGLVQGASKGEGLGNRFLAGIRETDTIVHVLRCFEDPDVAHVSGRVDPTEDAEIVGTELLLADLERVERHLKSLERRIRGGDSEAKRSARILGSALELLSAGCPVRLAEIPEEDRKEVRAHGLMTAKPVLYIANVREAEAATGNAASECVRQIAASEKSECIVLSAFLEKELAELEETDRKAFQNDLGLTDSGLERVVRAGYCLLGLITFFTAGPNEARAWTLPEGTRAVDAAGKIHSDFARGFIRAEVIGWETFVALGGETAAREAGLARSEGRDYRVQDGDVIRIRFKV